LKNSRASYVRVGSFSGVSARIDDFRSASINGRQASEPSLRKNAKR
jgi:hypothetical protein